MELICFFDLPVKTAKDRKNYRIFRKFLIKKSFTMMEESVYCRMAVAGNMQRAIIEDIRRNKPPKGLVIVLPVTEKQFADMEVITGEYSSDVVRTMDKVVIV